jgi:hypothetical protein
MPTTAAQTFGASGICPFYPTGYARQSVRLPANKTYPRGQVMAELAGADEVQTVTLTTGGTLGGTYTLSFAGATTGAIAFNATAATVQTALQALGTVGTNNVTVSGTTPTTAGGVLTVTFRNALGNQNVVAMTADGTNLTGTTPGITVATGTAGSGTTNELQTVAASGTVSGGTFTVTYAGQTTSALAYNVSPADMQTALEALSNLDPGDVTVTGTAGVVYLLRFGGTKAGTDVAAVTITNTGITGGGSYVVATASAGAAGTPGIMTAYDATATTGGQVPKGVLEFDCATDASGNITLGTGTGGGLFGTYVQSVPVFYKGDFATGELTGLDEAALAAAGWRLISGTIYNGVVRLP